MSVNEELLYQSWMLEQHDHSKTILEKDRLDRQVAYIKQRIEDYLGYEFDDAVSAVDSLLDSLW
jgi:hypothetical protein